MSSEDRWQTDIWYADPQGEGEPRRSSFPAAAPVPEQRCIPHMFDKNQRPTLAYCGRTIQPGELLFTLGEDNGEGVGVHEACLEAYRR